MKENKFNTKIKSIIEKLNTYEFELIFYSLKISLSCSLSNRNSIYSKMIIQRFLEEINEVYIQGEGLYSDLFVESYFSIK